MENEQDRCEVAALVLEPAIHFIPTMAYRTDRHDASLDNLFANLSAQTPITFLLQRNSRGPSENLILSLPKHIFAPKDIERAIDRILMALDLDWKHVAWRRKYDAPTLRVGPRSFSVLAEPSHHQSDGRPAEKS